MPTSFPSATKLTAHHSLDIPHLHENKGGPQLKNRETENKEPFQSFGRRWPFPEQYLHDAHFPIAGQPFFAAGISYFLKLSEHRHQSTNQEQDRVNHVIYNSIMASLLSAVKVDEQKRNWSNHIERRKHYAAKRCNNTEGHPQIWLLPESPQNSRYDDTCRSVGYAQHIAP